MCVCMLVGVLCSSDSILVLLIDKLNYNIHSCIHIVCVIVVYIGIVFSRDMYINYVYTRNTYISISTSCLFQAERPIGK